MFNASSTAVMVGLFAFLASASTWYPARFDPAPLLALVWSMLSMVSGMFPLQIALLAAVLLAVSVHRGAMLSGAGIVGLALGVAGILGLLAFVARQFSVRRAFDQAAGLPGTSATSTDKDQPQLWKIWRPLHYRLNGVERIADIPYGDAGMRNLLDIYRPVAAPGDGERRPVLLQVHGSGWMMGNKNHQALPLIYHMASHGWLVVSINYRLSPAARFPAHLIDVKKAIAWVRNNIAQYGGDPQFIAVTGGSAGGHLAALTPHRRDLQPGFEDIDTSVNSAVPIYGRYDFLCRDEPPRRKMLLLRMLAQYIMPGSPESAPELWELASPVLQSHADAPPFFVIQGSHDSLVPVEGARMFSERLRTVSRAPVIYAELKGLEHAFDMVQSPATEFTIHAIRRFLDLQYQLFLRREPASSLTPGEHS